MSTPADVDAYLAEFDDRRRAALDHLRATIRAVLPDAEECISYRLPAYRVGGKVVVGFGGFADHVAYLPHSGSVLGQLHDELAGYQQTKSSLHVPYGEPLPQELVARLIAVRCAEAGVG